VGQSDEVGQGLCVSMCGMVRRFDVGQGDVGQFEILCVINGFDSELAWWVSHVSYLFPIKARSVQKTDSHCK
jgi:hypothetical protein